MIQNREYEEKTSSLYEARKNRLLTESIYQEARDSLNILKLLKLSRMADKADQELKHAIDNHKPESDLLQLRKIYDDKLNQYTAAETKYKESDAEIHQIEREKENADIYYKKLCYSRWSLSSWLEEDSDDDFRELFFLF